MTTRSQPDAKHLTINGLRLRYLEWGRPDALPVVCVHGYTSSAEAFNALARRLQDRARIMAMDVRGHGESAWSPDGAYQYSDQAGDLTALVVQLGIEHFVVLGTSTSARNKGRRMGRPYGGCWKACRARRKSSGAPTATFCRKHRRSAWSQPCQGGSWSASLASDMRRPSSSRRSSPHSTAFSQPSERLRQTYAVTAGRYGAGPVQSKGMCFAEFDVDSNLKP